MSNYQHILFTRILHTDVKEVTPVCKDRYPRSVTTFTY